MTSEFSKESDKAYWAWSYKHLHMLDRENPVCRETFNAGFYLGAQYATRVTGEMSPHLARFLEFVMWLTDRADDSTTSAANTGTSSTENNDDYDDCFTLDEDDPNGVAIMAAHFHPGHRTELRDDDSVFCLTCQSTIAVADG